jgi:hypothetical protein
MKKKLKQLLAELNKEKALVIASIENADRIKGFESEAQYCRGKRNAFILCITELEKILK